MPAMPAGRRGPARVLGLDRNPLRRASDRAEAWIRIAVLAAFLVVGPLAATGAWHWVDHSVLAAVLTPVLVALALLTVLRLIRGLLNRWRLAAWDAAWSAIGPQWTGCGP